MIAEYQILFGALLGLTQKLLKSLIYRRRFAACRTPAGKQATRSVSEGEGYRQDAFSTRG
ncbi:MAG: hypothetical protein RMZ69_34095 [Nostoc sp. ChiQUE01a]|nr:hypothetical protein [Nostoc sp. ChiQUE01a]